jgi:hypothetical protein
VDTVFLVGVEVCFFAYVEGRIGENEIDCVVFHEGYVVAVAHEKFRHMLSPFQCLQIVISGKTFFRFATLGVSNRAISWLATERFSLSSVESAGKFFVAKKPICYWSVTDMGCDHQSLS